MAFRGSWGDEVLEWGSARWGKMVLEGAAVGSGGWVKLCHASGVHHWKEEVCEGWRGRKPGLICNCAHRIVLGNDRGNVLPRANRTDFKVC
jgi:hypothetical protein